MTDEHSMIASHVGALATLVDARRWDDLLDLFAPQVTADWTSLFGGELQVLTREQLVANWRQLLPGFARTTHVISVPTIAIAGDVAQASASVIAWHLLATPAADSDLWLVGGCYEFVFVRQNGSWRFSSLTLARAWSHGNQDAPRVASERVAATTT